ncbi:MULTISPECIES: hypothetical protein [unclassified Pseudomonas]|uniref:hypothetical protein n=1 Tax=unclassified Pseudomonas TaxID=196821 RepID=UPI0021196F8F|nr:MULTISPECIES: hypothetical protein [unclassified Pseudomonas]
MRAAAEEARHDYFEYLYVHRDDSRRTIQLFAGNHPISANDDGSPLTEGGAALVLSQDIQFGHVAALIYPYETSLGAGKPIFWGFFDSPTDAIAGKWLDRAVHDFARCCRASSIVDQTAYPSDRLRMRWLKFRSWALCFRGRFPGGTKLICAKPSWGRRIIAGIFVVLTTVTALLNLPSMVATLSGYTVPRLWALLHDGPAVDSAPPSGSEVSGSVASPAANSSQKAIPRQTEPAITPAVIGVEMPVISGWYTFCPTSADQGSPKLLDLLYDVRANAGKVAFFDIQVDVDCILGRQPDYEAAFSRIEDADEVIYLLRVPLVMDGAPVTPGQWISGKRDPSVLRAMYSDNGSAIAIHNGNDSRNPLSRFQPHVEGSSDILFGPYAIKESSDDDAITFDLNASFLDSAALQQATIIAEELRATRALPTTLPSPVGKGGS